MSTNEIRVVFTGQDSGASATAERVAASMQRVNANAADQARLMRQLAPQFTDVFTSIAAGQNPLMVFLQQGGQMKDLAGGTAPLLRALGSAFTPFVAGATAAAAAVGILGTAWYQGQQESAAFRDHMALTGGAAGVTEGAFNALAQRSAEAAGATVGAGRDIAQGLAASGRIGSVALETVTTAALRVQSVSGKAAEDIVADFARMGSGVADWASQHNQAWHFATADQLAYIRTLEDAGLQQQAMVETGNLLIEHLRNQTTNLGYLESAWKATTGAASSFWEMLKSIGREQTAQDRLDAARRKLAEDSNAMRNNTGGSSGYVYGGTPEQYLEKLQQDINTANRDVLRQTEAASTKSAAAFAEEERGRNLAETERLTKSLSGANQQYIKDLESIQKLAKDGAITEEMRVELLKQAAVKYGEKPKKEGSKPVTEQDLFFSGMSSFIFDNNMAGRRLLEADEKALARAMEKDAQMENERAAKDASAQLRRRDTAERLAADLIAENERLNIQMIADDRQRGLAQIEADRAALQSRLDRLAEFGVDVSAAEAALAEQVVARQKSLAESLKPEWQVMIDGWQDAGKTMADAWNDSMADMLGGASDAFGRWAAGMEVSVDSLVRMFVAKMASAAFNEMAGSLFGSLFGSVGGSVLGAATGGAGVPILEAHTGALVGSGEGGRRALGASLYRNAPRYHTGGIAGNEVPAVLLRGEGVFTPGQMRALGAGLQRGANAGPSVAVHQTIHLQIDARSDQAQVAALAARAMAEGRKQTLADLKALKLIR